MRCALAAQLGDRRRDAACVRACVCACMCAYACLAVRHAIQRVVFICAGALLDTLRYIPRDATRTEVRMGACTFQRVYPMYIGRTRVFIFLFQKAGRQRGTRACVFVAQPSLTPEVHHCFFFWRTLYVLIRGGSTALTCTTRHSIP